MSAIPHAWAASAARRSERARGLGVLLACGALLGGCAIPRTIDRLQETAPPPEFGRPGWVRFLAGTGAWIGGVAGGVVTVVLLPVTYPLSLLAGDELGEGGSEELILFPAIGGATAGHFLLGAPADVVDHVFRRAWFEEPQPENTYELVPMQPPRTPAPADASAAAAATPGVTTPPEGVPPPQTPMPSTTPGGTRAPETPKDR